MYIFRWLMKHPVIILVLYFLSIAAILYSMTRTSTIETDATDAPKVNVEEITEVDLSAAPKIEPSTLTSSVNQEPATESESVTNTELTMATDDGGESEIEVAESATEEVAAQATVSSDQASAQFGEMNADELLLMAREAYWNNGLEESAEIYQQLIEMNPEVIDYKGELGNVYWRQGFPKKAAELYAEISLPMIEEGNADRVANMVGFIGLFFPEKATEIHNKLHAVK